MTSGTGDVDSSGAIVGLGRGAYGPFKKTSSPGGSDNGGRPSIFDSDGGRLQDSDSTAMLYKEINSLKSCVQCIKVLKQLLNDRDVSLTSLEKENKGLKLALEHLQSRLHRNKLNSSVELKENEVFVPGHDKSILKDLLNQLTHLKRILADKYSSEEVAEAQKTIKDLQAKVYELSSKLKMKEKEFKDYLEDMKSSDNEKNAKISKLTSDLRKYYAQRENDDAVRLTMCSEVEQLKVKLDVFIMEMDHMAGEIKDYEQKLREKETNPLKSLEKLERLSNDSGLSLRDECRSLQEQTTSLTRENDELGKQLKNVISMNTRWQRYSDQREAYVVQLSGKHQITVSENKVLDSKCQELMRKVSELEKSLKKKDLKQKESTDAAIISLEVTLSRSNEENLRLTKKITTLEKQIQQQRSPSPEQSERIMLLEHQVKSLTEDFEMERKDRTGLQGRYQQLMEKNDYLTSVNKNLNEQIAKQYAQQTSRMQPQVARPYFNPYSISSQCGYNASPINQKIFRRDTVEVDGCDFTDGADSSIDSPKSPNQMQRIKGAQTNITAGYNDDNTIGSLEEEEQLLRCPRCHKGFKVMEHALLVNHVDTCDESQDDLEIG